MASITQRQLGQILDDLVRQGAKIQKRSKNVRKITFPDATTIVVHSSPSDTNWHHYLRRATVRAGLHWPGENRKQLKTILREKAGRNSVTSFITEYGGHVSESVSQDAQDRIARELSGKSETRIPLLVERTGISQPTVMKALIRLGWLQRSERVIETIETADGRRTGTTRAYWSPAPEDILQSVVFKGRSVQLTKADNGRFTTLRTAVQPTVTVPVVEVDTPQVEPVETEPTPIEPTAPIPADEPEQPDTEGIEALRGGPVDLEQAVTAARTDDEWFAEAARQEARAIEAERQSKLNALEARRNAERLEELQGRHTALVATMGARSDGSWSAPGIADLPETTTIAELFATLRLMGLTPEIRLSRNEDAA